MKKRARMVATVCLALTLSGCTSNAVQLLDAIVSSVEIALPLMQTPNPHDAANISAYLNAVLVVTNDVLNSGATTEKIQSAVSDFKTIVVPVLSEDVSPKTVALVSAVALAVQVFIVEYEAHPVPAIGMSAAQIAKVQTLKQRVVKARKVVRP